MMTSHIITSQIITSQNVGLMVILAAICALLPDLDAQHSKIRSLKIGPLRPLDRWVLYSTALGDTEDRFTLCQV